MPRISPSRSLLALAWLNVVLHVLALALAAVGMRPGSPLVPLEERLAYLAGAPLGWTLGWVAWMFCAAALIAFLATLAQQLGAPAQLGLMIAVAGAAFDLCCDCLYILVFPMLASAQPEALFLVVERATGIASLVIANGAYAVAILLLTVAMHGWARSTRAVGYLVAGGGLLLAGAGFTGVPWHAEWATPPTIGLFCLLVLLVAYEPAGRSS